MHTFPLGHTAHHPNGAVWLALPYVDLADVPSPNKRTHWALRSKQTRTLRDTANWMVKKAKLGPCTKIMVELHYLPPDNRRRDTDNLVLALKALCDGLVDAGIVPDDTPTFMLKTMPVIHPRTDLKPGQSRLLLRIMPTA